MRFIRFSLTFPILFFQSPHSQNQQKFVKISDYISKVEKVQYLPKIISLELPKHMKNFSM